jgi:hypothetical protein
MPSLEPILEKLACAQDRLLRAVHTIPVDSWTTRPRGRLLVRRRGHCSRHNCRAYGGRRGWQNSEEAAQANPVPEAVSLPLAVAEIRLVRMKTPIPIDLQLLREKELMLAELQEVRGGTLRLIEETKDRDLHVYRWPHPFLGSLNAYQWFELLGSHQNRHEKQIREITAHLRTVGRNSEH